MDDKINYAFSLAFTTSPDGLPQPHVIPTDDNDEMDEVQWYTPVHVRQNKQSNKRVCFGKSTKPPKPILHETPEIEFKLGSKSTKPLKPILYETLEIEFKLDMNIIFKDGTGKSECVVYKGAKASVLKHVMRCIK